jgi:hypothetical protein
MNNQQYFVNVTVARSMTVNNHGRLLVQDNLTLDHGTVTLMGHPPYYHEYGGDLHFSGAASQSIDGTGEIHCIGFGSDLVMGSGRLAIGSGITVRGGGAIGLRFSGVTATVINNGKIIGDVANAESAMYIYDPLLNRGVLEAREGGKIFMRTPANYSSASRTLTGGQWNVYGDSMIAVAELSFAYPIATNAASIRLDGAGSTWDMINVLSRNPGTFAVTSGRDFTTEGPLDNSGGTIRIGIGSDLDVSGAFAETSASRLVFELAGVDAEQYGQLFAAGPATLSGELTVNLALGFEPSLGDSFELLQASSVSGTFSSVVLPVLSTGIAWHVDYRSSSVTLLVVPEPTATGVGLLAPATAILLKRRSR